MPITDSLAELDHINFNLCQITETHINNATNAEFYLRIVINSDYHLYQSPAAQANLSNFIPIQILTKKDNTSPSSTLQIHLGTMALPQPNHSIEFSVDFYEFPPHEDVPQGDLNLYFTGHPEIQLAVRKRKKITYTRVPKKNFFTAIVKTIKKKLSL